MPLKTLFKDKKQTSETPTPVPPEEPVEKKKKRKTPQDRSKLTRNKVVQIRLTEDEVAALKAAAAAVDMTLADFVMAATKESPVIVIDNFYDVLNELRREGGNLNQLVKLANTTQNLDHPYLPVAVQHCIEAQAEFVRMCDYWNMKLREKTEKKGE